MKIVATNKKASFEYFIHQKIECGIMLYGSEVKAIRSSRINIKDSFVRIVKGEAFLFNTHIGLLNTTNNYFKHDETRTRKLLLHKKEINKLFGYVSQKGYTLVPLSVYFNAKNCIKVQIALASGKKLYDKREALKQKSMQREAQIELKKWR